MSKTKKPDSLPAKSYEPTSQDRKVMQAYFEEQRVNPPPPRLKVVKEDEGTVGLFRLNTPKSIPTIRRRLMH
jgi:hypothetical protein